MSIKGGGIMTQFKITDVRVKYAVTSTGTTVYIDGLGVGENLNTSANPTRAALMLAVFNSGRDCYWDSDAQALVTSPIPYSVVGAESPLANGRVTSWDVRIPITGDIEYLASLLGADEHRQTSGNAAAGWMTVKTNEQHACVVFTILSSRYCTYQNGLLRNTDIVQ